MHGWRGSATRRKRRAGGDQPERPAETRRAAARPTQPARTRSPHPLGRHPPQTRAAASPRLHLQGEQVSETVGSIAMIGVGAVAAATMMAGALLILALVAAVEAPLIARYVLYRK